MQKITPNLWFDSDAEDAVNRYTSIFDNSLIGPTSRYDEASAEASGRPIRIVLTVDFELKVLPELLRDKDTKKAGRATKAMLQMRKIDIQTLEEAHAR